MARVEFEGLFFRYEAWASVRCQVHLQVLKEDADIMKFMQIDCVQLTVA